MTECIVSFVPACFGVAMGCIAGGFVATDAGHERLCKKLRAVGIGVLAVAGFLSPMTVAFQVTDEGAGFLFDLLNVGVPLVAAATIPTGVGLYVLNAIRLGRTGAAENVPPHPLLAGDEAGARRDGELL